MGEIIELTRADDCELLFDLKYCHRELSITFPLLDKKPVRNYVPLPGHEGVFFLCMKLPTYRRALEKHLDKLKGA